MIEPKHVLTPEEYLALEAQSPDKHEFWRGETYLTAGASLNHNRIVFNTAKALDRRLEPRSSSVWSNDVRLRIEREEVYTYPDVMVICGKIETDSRQQDTVTNPTVIVEVLSESTAAYDRGRKFKMYRHIDSLQQYILVDQTQPYVEAYRRDGRFWVLETFEGMDAALQLRQLDVEIPLAELYAQVEREMNQ